MTDNDKHSILLPLRNYIGHVMLLYSSLELSVWCKFTHSTLSVVNNVLFIKKRILDLMINSQVLYHYTGQAISIVENSAQILVMSKDS